MSRLWVKCEQGRWRAHPVPAADLLPGDALGAPGVGLLGLRQGAALLARAGAWVRVNGEPVLGGFRLLGHKDEVLTEAGRWFFSAESAPVVTTFALPAGGRVPTCPVCRGPVREGTAAVQCPGCGRWAHQADGRECWAYAAACRFCNHPTSFAAEAAWRPGEED